VTTVIVPEWLIDGTGAPPRTEFALAFDGSGRITTVGPAQELTTVETDRVVRAPGQTLLPGLINMHVHLSLASDNSPFVPYMDTHSDVALALRAVHNARASLEAGITTVRDCGARLTTVLDVRDAHALGLVTVARIVSCGWPLTISGGHMRPFGGEVDGEVGARQMVRRVISAGADFIKVAGSGGGTPGSISDQPSFLPDELQSIVRTAHGLGRRVTMHCTATAAVANAVAARVDSIEHGYFSAPGALCGFDDAVAEGLAEAQIPVTPTLQVARDMVETAPSEADRDTWRRRRDAQWEMMRRLHRAGVRLLVGSDAGWRYTRFNDLWRELQELVVCGLSPLEAINGATGAAAAAIRRADEFGSLRPGLSADLLLVRGNAADDVGCVANVETVYLQGRQITRA
jgi:imidazolonepropionase-like amidohydrolase